MARRSKTAAIDYTAAHDLTHGLLERAACPDGVAFTLLKDSDKKGLRLRVTKAGGKHWQFETRIKGKLFTRALGEWPAVGLDVARKEAHRLRGLAEQGQDPRELERQQADREQAEALRQQAQDETERAAAIAQAMTVGEVWTNYLEQRRPFWGALHYRDHIDKAKAGGEPSQKRGGKFALTQPGPLAILMPLRMVDLTQERIEAWAALEGQTRPSSARLAWRLLTVFMTWCGEQPEYRDLVPSKNPAKTRKAREALGKAGTKSDNLQKGQLPAWFAAVQQLPNPVIAAYLQIMLLTGARPNEVMGLRWEDVTTQWKGIAIRDKVEGTREIPLTPYVAHLMASLPRRNEWVFSSPTSASGCLTEPNTPHHRACKVAGLNGLTLHGLRRSFKSLCEWQEALPVGVVAQIMGHKPSATAEKHYVFRPLELLALHHERIEAWILEQAGIVFDAQAEPGKLRVVAG
jgi:integrase